MIDDRTSRSAAPRLRADATRNRERIVAAAQEACIEFGPDVPLDEIARRAGIGNATLYRHFADRRLLMRSVVLAVLDRMAGEAESRTAENPDSFAVLQDFVHGAVDWKVGALCPLLSESLDLAEPELQAARDRLNSAVESIIARAQAQGTLRTDIGLSDIMLVVAQLTRPLPGTEPSEHHAFVHRHLQLLLDGLRAPAPSVLPGRPATAQDLRRDCRPPDRR